MADSGRVDNQIQKMKTPMDLRGANDSSWPSELTPAEWIWLLRAAGAIWIRPNENPKAPHIELQNGRLTSSYVSMGRVSQFPALVSALANQLVKKVTAYQSNRISSPHINVVISSSNAAVQFGSVFAAKIGAGFVHTQYVNGPDGKFQVFAKDFSIAPGEVVLPVEDLITTSRTLEQVYSAVLARHPDPIAYAPFVVAYVNRSGGKMAKGNKPIVAGLDLNFGTYKAEESPFPPESPRLKGKVNISELVKFGNAA